MPTVTIRTATPADLEIITALEAACFPPAEAASRESYAARLARFADRYWLLFLDGELVALAGGSLSCDAILSDEMYADAALHDPAGGWQMIFSVATRPDCRHRGYGSAVLRTVIDGCRKEGREGLVLACKPALRPFYAALGFADEGLSASAHGGAVWHQMRLEF